MVPTIKPKDYITGSLQIKAEDVGASGWLMITREAERICKPYLKYLPGFVPIREMMNDWRRKRSTSDAVVKYFKGFKAESLCVWLTAISRECEGELPPVGEARFIMEKDLLLSRKGQLVLWDAKYERKKRYNSNRQDDYDLVEIAIYSRFTEVLDVNLLALFDHYPRLGRDIVNKLWRLVTEGIEERQKRLRNLNEVERTLAGFLKRVE
jgi:hypothetical protein